MSQLATLAEENSEDFVNDSSERDGSGLVNPGRIGAAGIFEGSDEDEDDADADDEEQGDEEEEEEDDDHSGGGEAENYHHDDHENEGRARRAMKYGRAVTLPEDRGHHTPGSTGAASSNSTVNNESRTTNPTPISPRSTKMDNTRAALQQKQQDPDMMMSKSFRRANSGPPATSSSASFDANKSFRMSLGSPGAGGGSGGTGSGSNTPNKMDFNSLSRSSRHLADSIVNKSMALARMTSRASSMEEDAATAVLQSQQPKRNIYRGYVVGDNVLVSIDHHPYSRGVSLVNKLGYPYGAGTTEEEKRGPYVYVLAKVKRVHFEEYSVYYTVTREDTGAEMRGEAGTVRSKTQPAYKQAYASRRWRSWCMRFF
jgi:hypothetical protein